MTEYIDEHASTIPSKLREAKMANFVSVVKYLLWYYAKRSVSIFVKFTVLLAVTYCNAKSFQRETFWGFID